MNFSWDKTMPTRTFSRSTDSVGWWAPQPAAHRSPSTQSLGEPENKYNAAEDWFTYGARFQQRQLAEREQKMVALLEERQARALGRVRAEPTQVTHTQGKVRQMFEERRQQQQHGGAGAGAGGARAGVDRGHPLRPIRHENKKSEYDTHTKTKDVNHNSVHHEHNIIIERFENINLKYTDEMDNVTNIEDETFPESLCSSPAVRHVPPVLAPLHSVPQRPSRTKPVPPVRKSRASPPKVTRKAPTKTISNGNRSSDDDVVMQRDQQRARELLQETSTKDQSQAKVKLELSDDEIRDRDEDDSIRNRIRQQEENLHDKYDGSMHSKNKNYDQKEELIHDNKVEESTFNPGQNGDKDKQTSRGRVRETEETRARPARSQATKASPARAPASPSKVVPTTKSRSQAAAPRASPPKSLGKNAMSTPRQANKSGASSTAAVAACAVCGRTFSPDRVEKHQKICQKSSSKKRKPYDILKHRVAGTEAEPFLRQLRKQQTLPTSASATKGGRAPPAGSTNTSSAKPLNSTWRQKHEDFIRSIRAAKKVQAHIAAGGSVKDLPPPPPSENPDYVQCPHCQRRFNKAAAERHIPKCADFQFNKPKPQGRTAPPTKKPPGPNRPARR